MFGTVFAIVNRSACRAVPSAAASIALRTKPLSRETTVPAAIRALDDSTPASVPDVVREELTRPPGGAAAVRGWRAGAAPAGRAGPRWPGPAGPRRRP